MGLAHRLWPRRRAGVRHPAGAAPRARKSALADDARPLRGSRGRGAADRKRDRRHPQGGWAPRHPPPALGAMAPGHPRTHGAIPRAGGVRPDADGLAGVLLQRDLLHLCAGARALLRRAGRSRRLLHLPVRHRQLPGPAGARASFRQRRPALHDRRDLCGVRRRAARHRLRLPAGNPDRDHAGARLVGDLLRRLGGGELGLSYGERSVPAGDARHFHLAVLRRRHRARRLSWAAAVRRDDRERQPQRAVRRLRLRRGADAGRGDRHAVPRRRRQPLEEVCTPLGSEPATKPGRAELRT